jgi:hypothetical protein
VVIAGVATSATVAGCGGGSSGGGQPSVSASSSTSAETAAVRRNWETFFDGKTPTARREQLLQNGSRFRVALQAAAASPLAGSSSATVTSVSLVTPTTAIVKYSITVGGQPGLTDQQGEAVLIGGVWQVSDLTFCGLARLESGGHAVPGCPNPGSSPSTSSTS